MIKTSLNAKNAVENFEYLCDLKLFNDSEVPTTMHIFLPRLNGRDFDIDSIKNNLIEVVIDYALTRKTIKKYEKDKRWNQLSQEARSKFRVFTENKGELGELMLYTFLEGHLKAPKILSKMSLKTSPGDYTKKSDGIHLLKLENENRYHLIFGEAKMYKNITEAFKYAFQSISEHKDGKDFEISLISSQIENEFIVKEDKKLLLDILYPKSSQITQNISDAFGVFIGFEFDDTKGKNMSEKNYEIWVKKEVKTIIEKKLGKIEEYIQTEWVWYDNGKEKIKKSLLGKNFYVYLMPFTNLDESRKLIIKGVTQ